jgi:transposase
MEKKQFVGIDVSKDTLDVFIYGFEKYFIVENNPKGFVELLETINKITKCKNEEIIFCFENTGKYSKLLSVFFHSELIPFVMEPALKIKKSLGITRGKNDKVDSKRISNYAYEKRENITATVLPGEKIDKMKSLLSLREKLVKHRTAYKNGLTDLHDCYKEGENDLIKDVQTRLLNSLDEEIDKVEKEIHDLVNDDVELSKNFKLILSVKGVGKIIGYYLIAYTANFTKFLNARSFACYAGIAPFGYSSGTVIGKSKVHPLGNKDLKKLFNLAASSVIQRKGEFKQYFERRVNEMKKSKMSTLNIIRNKIVSRVFAVIKRGTPYVDLCKFAA